METKKIRYPFDDDPVFIAIAKKNGFETPLEAMINFNIVQGYSYEKISEIFGCSHGTIKKYMQRYYRGEVLGIKDNNQSYSTKYEIKFIRDMHKKGKLLQYVEGLKLRKRWGGMNKYEILDEVNRLTGESIF